MTIEEFKALTNEIIENAGNQGELSIRLEKLTENVTNIITSQQTQAAELDKIKAEKETLGKANTQLWLKLGYKAENTKHELKEEEADFSKLFNDKGELI